LPLQELPLVLSQLTTSAPTASTPCWFSAMVNE
jgi:hypothetical protein